MQEDVLPMVAQSRHEETRRKGSGTDVGTVVARCQSELAAMWNDDAKRLAYCPAKELLSRINSQLQTSKFKAVSAYSLSKEIRRDEIPDEFATLLRRIERDTQ
jgi:hypothetical protein